MEKEPLTAKQKELLDYFKFYIGLYDLPPTYREAAESLACSIQNIQQLTAELVRKGYLQRRPQRSRAITVL